MIELRTRHLAILGATALGTMAMFTGQSENIILATIGLISGSFIWDKIQNKSQVKKK